MMPLTLNAANKIKELAFLAGFPAYVFHYGDKAGFYAVQVVKQSNDAFMNDIFEPLSKANKGKKVNYGFTHIIGGIIITSSDSF